MIKYIFITKWWYSYFVWNENEKRFFTEYFLVTNYTEDWNFYEIETINNETIKIENKDVEIIENKDWIFLKMSS